MFCRQLERHDKRQEINMAIVLRISVFLAVTATISHLPLVTARSSASSSASSQHQQQQQQQPQSSSVSANNDNDDDNTRLIDSNSIQWRPENTSGQPVIDLPSGLKRVFLTNRTVTCNDGSQAGFYLRKSSKSKRWVVFFEGGWHCYDNESCKTRWTKLRNLMTSAKWPEYREDVGGILSPSAEENPYWHNANHILVPYCSSDSWSGTRQRGKDRWSFMGSLIVRQVIADLIPLGLGRSQGGELLLAGSSAGGLGVMLNLDKVKKFLRDERSIKISVRGVSDSGWFLDREPFALGAISGSDVVKQGHALWEGSLPEACVAAHPTEPWRCYFGHRIYPFLKAPLFVFQWLFDEAQMRADSVGAPVTKKQWDYIHETGISLRASLDNVTAVFAPSCIGHSVLTKREWLDIKIDEISLPEALRCWEKSTGRGNKDLTRRASEGIGTRKMNEKRRQKIERKRRQRERRRRQQQRIQERKERQLWRQEKQRQREERRLRNGVGHKLRHNKNATVTTIMPAASTFPRSGRSPQPNENSANTRRTDNYSSSVIRPQRGYDEYSESKPRKEHKQQSNQFGHSRRSNHKRKRIQERQQQPQHIFVPEPSRCALRLLERCSWPQCNHSCPSITNPLTGKEMRFLELLASFGLDIEAVATALGVDMTTLSNMDRTELLNLLTQTS